MTTQPSTTTRKRAKDVIEREAERMGIPINRLLVHSRERKLSRRRQAVMLAVYTECPHISYPTLGRLMGRDHTTILYGVRQAAKRAGMTYEDVLEKRANNGIQS